MKRIAFYLMLPFLYVVSVTPFRIIYALSNFLAFFYRVILHYRRNLVLKNLKMSFPYREKKEVSKIMSAFYVNFTDTLLEILKMRSISKSELRRRVIIRDIAFLNSYIDQGRSIILVTSHYANWEWGGLAISLALKTQSVFIVYQPMKNRYFQAYINRLRSRFGSRMVTAKQLIRNVRGKTDKPAVIILAADQLPGENDNNYNSKFLNQETLFYNGPEKVARILNAGVVFAELSRLKRGFYEMTMFPLVNEPLASKANDITKAYINRLEEVIEHEPANWLWTNSRW